jgi:hypothetical protein
MTNTDNRLLILNKELEENFAHLDRQHTQVKWFVQLYTFALGGFFAFSGYLANQTSSAYSSIAGISAGFLVFCLGWLLLVTLAHKLAIIILTHKQIAVFRGHRLSLLDSKYETDYVFPTSSQAVRFAKAIDTTPYIFFVVNYVILCGSTGFYVSRVLGIWVGVTTSLAIGIIVGLVYPRSCVIFAKHIRTAKLATSLMKMHELEQAFENLRKEAKKEAEGRHNLFYKACISIITFFVLVGIGLALLNIWVKLDSSRIILLSFSVLNACLFGVVRYKMEKIKGFKVSMVGHKT